MTSKTSCERIHMLKMHLCAIPVPTIRDALNLDDSAVSRIKSGERRLSFEEFVALIALPSTRHPQGLALAPARAIIITKEQYRALRVLARDALNMEDDV